MEFPDELTVFLQLCLCTPISGCNATFALDIYLTIVCVIFE